MDNQKTEWKYDGTLWDFIEIVQWSLVMREVMDHKKDELWTIMASPELVRNAADEYGITYQAVADEMVRCGRDAQTMLELIRGFENDEN